MSTTSVEKQIAAVRKKLNKEINQLGKDGGTREQQNSIRRLKEQLDGLQGSESGDNSVTRVTQVSRSPVNQKQIEKKIERRNQNGRKALTINSQTESSEKKKEKTGTVLDTITSQRRQRRVSRSPLVQASYKKKRGY